MSQLYRVDRWEFQWFLSPLGDDLFSQLRKDNVTVGKYTEKMRDRFHRSSIGIERAREYSIFRSTASHDCCAYLPREI